MAEPATIYDAEAIEAVVGSIVATMKNVVEIVNLVGVMSSVGRVAGFFKKLALFIID